jgi:PKD repeat protein
MKLPYIAVSFFLLVFLSITPAMAYTLLGTTTVSNTAGTVPASATIVINSSTNWINVTHLEATLGEAATADHTFTNVCIKRDNDYAQVGTGTFTYSGTSFSADITFSQNPDHRDLVWSTSGSCNGMGGWLPDLNIRNGAITTNYLSDPYGFALVYPGGTYEGKGTYRAYGGTAVVAPVTSFSCVPTTQNPDADIVCTDTSTNSPTSWLWSIDMVGAGINGWQTHTGQNFTWQTHYPGLYSVNLWANNSAGSDWENKTNYVYIGTNVSPNNCNLPVATGYVRSMAQCVDSQTSGSIHGCAISMKDQEANAWSNNSATVSGTWCIDTYPLHHISAYGSATGYSSVYRTDLLASDSIMYELLMVPGYVPPAATGKVWLYVMVNDLATGATIPGAQVSISGSGQATQTGTTDSTGSVHKQWANVSTAYVSVSATGYSVGTKTIVTSNFGPDVVRVELSKGTITVAPSQTVGPGGTTYPTVGPYGTPGPSGTMAPGYTNNQGQMMIDYLAAHGMDLIQLCFLVTVCALLGIKFGK